MSEDVFQQYSAFYDLLYRDKDYGRESTYIVETLRAASPSVKSLLEFGSGTGRHGRLLAASGFEVFGVERSARMVAVASSQPAKPSGSLTGSFACIQGDINTVQVGRTFDAVAALFHVVSYQVSNADVLKTFVNAAHHLRPGGIFVFDVWHGPAVLAERPSVRKKQVEDEEYRVIRIAEPEMDTQSGVVLVRYTLLAQSKADDRLVTFQEEHRMRYFFRTEIDLLARSTGFDLERDEEFLTRNTPSEKTWGVTYVLRKKDVK